MAKYIFTRIVTVNNISAIIGCFLKKGEVRLSAVVGGTPSRHYNVRCQIAESNKFRVKESLRLTDITVRRVLRGVFFFAI